MIHQHTARLTHRSLSIPIALIGILFAGCDIAALNGLPAPNPGPTGAEPTFIMGSAGDTNSIDPATLITVLEQLSLERLNRARLRPGDEAAAGGIAIDEGLPPGALNITPKQPLAMNPTLHLSAIGHSRDMLDRDYFAHISPEGVSPFDRMQIAGYLFVHAGENLAWRGTTGTLDPVRTVETQHRDLFVDEGIEDRGHRVTMLNPNLREVGIGIVPGSFTDETGMVYTDSIMQTQDFGTTPFSSTFVLGVIYHDNNANNQYDAGEGVPGTSVSLEDVSKTTNEAGGYSFEVGSPGTYTLRFAGGREAVVVMIETGDPNIKIDFVDASRIVVNLGRGMLK